MSTPKDSERKRFEHTVLIKLHGKMMDRVHQNNIIQTTNVRNTLKTKKFMT